MEWVCAPKPTTRSSVFPCIKVPKWLPQIGLGFLRDAFFLMTVINACAKWRHGGKTFQKPDGKTLKRDESFCNFLTHFLSAMLISYNKVGCFFLGGGGWGGTRLYYYVSQLLIFLNVFFFPSPFFLSGSTQSWSEAFGKAAESGLFLRCSTKRDAPAIAQG